MDTLERGSLINDIDSLSMFQIACLYHFNKKPPVAFIETLSIIFLYMVFLGLCEPGFLGLSRFQVFLH